MDPRAGAGRTVCHCPGAQHCLPAPGSGGLTLLGSPSEGPAHQSRPLPGHLLAFACLPGWQGMELMLTSGPLTQLERLWHPSTRATWRLALCASARGQGTRSWPHRPAPGPRAPFPEPSLCLLPSGARPLLPGVGGWHCPRQGALGSGWRGWWRWRLPSPPSPPVLGAGPAPPPLLPLKLLLFLAPGTPALALQLGAQNSCCSRWWCVWLRVPPPSSPRLPHSRLRKMQPRRVQPATRPHPACWGQRVLLEHEDSPPPTVLQSHSSPGWGER